MEVLTTEKGEVTLGKVLFDGEWNKSIHPDRIVRRGMLEVMEGRRITAARSLRPLRGQGAT